MAIKPDKVDGKYETSRFAELSYDRFRAMARDSTLSLNERMGMPDAFRDGYEDAIMADICAKLPVLGEEGRTIVDIGCGCGLLTLKIMELCAARGHRLIMVDSPEMLELVPDAPHIVKVPGAFPDCKQAIRAEAPEGADGILIYGVLQVIFGSADIFGFAADASRLLRPHGQLLFGDISNFSKTRRFLATPEGVEHHKAYMRTNEPPVVPPFPEDDARIDDSVIFALLMRLRGSGFEAYVMPQAADLPLANRREDILVVRR
ncbi:class I SAM-dependent methyltransferase [Ancylobacter pratisalsi]|uniref:Class I SAM-dependent methyltransferase n=1 Tax=Ancylobacter pratisalsi TaxID=1745854 RepID=A0A6P1YHD5_9HYPH|nr:class I SAM-dependent methyltransferase [Ancylobacter pratisalsi]QIB32707.1 class I SAM-dependent methyltransferase [Ancylobacter pratisalsi]